MKPALVWNFVIFFLFSSAYHAENSETSSWLGLGSRHLLESDTLRISIFLKYRQHPQSHGETTLGTCLSLRLQVFSPLGQQGVCGSHRLSRAVCDDVGTSSCLRQATPFLEGMCFPLVESSHKTHEQSRRVNLRILVGEVRRPFRNVDFQDILY